MPRLILFDIDGTLVTTGGAGRASTRAAMLQVFGTCGQLDQHRFSGKTDWFTLIELLTPEGFSTEAIDRRRPHYERVVGEHLRHFIGNYAVEACYGALNAVLRLRQNPEVRLGVVTGNVSTTAPVKLRAAGYHSDWFPVGAYGFDALHRDDLPSIAIERAQKHYQQTFDPREVIIIGDTAMDVSCARAVGAVAVAVRTGIAPEGELEAAMPDYLLDDLTRFEEQVLAQMVR
jgi:phosphoglycolate phosphatase